jgi:hypothetical protein
MENQINGIKQNNLEKFYTVFIWKMVFKFTLKRAIQLKIEIVDLPNF